MLLKCFVFFNLLLFHLASPHRRLFLLSALNWWLSSYLQTRKSYLRILSTWTTLFYAPMTQQNWIWLLRKLPRNSTKLAFNCINAYRIFRLIKARRLLTRKFWVSNGTKNPTAFRYLFP